MIKSITATLGQMTVILALITSCASRPEAQDHCEAIKPYLEELYASTHYRPMAPILCVTSAALVGASSIGKALGVCRVSPKSLVIELDSDYVARASHADVMVLVMHEITHCDFGMQHFESALIAGSNCPSSYMGAMHMSSECSKEFLSTYKQEFVSRLIYMTR